MNYVFYSEAEEELNQAIDYYEICKKGLGQKFADEAYKAIQRIIDFPDAWAILSPNTRRCLLRDFPYGIIYQILPDKIIIIAVAQLNRKPGYWLNRIKVGL